MAKKIKYQGGITKYLTGKIAAKNRAVFLQELYGNSTRSLMADLIEKAEPLSIQICSFSSDRDFADQILSILSCLRYLGKPVNWTIYSDGSHTNAQVNFLGERFPFIILKKMEWGDCTALPDLQNQHLIEYAPQILHYAKEKPLGKRLYYYLNHRVELPTLFLDADILFYPKARHAFEMMLQENCAGWFLPDANWGCLDSRYKAVQREQTYQVNGGFFIFMKPLETIETGMQFLKSLNFRYEYFSDQNVFHIQFKEAGFIPMDPRVFVLDSGDQFDFQNLKARSEMAIRHFTGPVRHKMWQQGWKWQLGLN